MTANAFATVVPARRIRLVHKVEVPVQNFRVIRVFLGSITAIILAGCGGGGDGVPPPPVLSISNLTFSPTGIYVGSGAGGKAQISGQVDFSTPGSALSSATVTVLDSTGATVSTSNVPIQGANSGATGTIKAAWSISTAVHGNFTLQIYVTNAAGQHSNTLTGPFKVNNFPWSQLPAQPMPRDGGAVVAIGSKFYVLGGTGILGGSQSVEIFDASVGTWTEGPMLPARMQEIAAAVVGTNIYIVAGTWFPVDVGDPITIAYALDSTLGQWVAKSAIPAPVRVAAAVALDNKIYVMGGSSNQPSLVSTVSVYDPMTDTWSTAAPLPQPAAGFMASVVNSKIYAFGLNLGSGGLTLEYDPASNSWSTITTTGPNSVLGYSLEFNSAAVLNGLVYSIGGETVSLSQTANDSVFDPTTKTWSLKEAPTTSVVTSANAAGTYDGKIYLFLESGSFVYNPVDDLN